MTSRPILLFKELSPDNEYETVFQEKGYEAKCIPVLQTTTTNTDLLLEYLANPEDHGLRGVIITSKRSCDSLAEALAKLCSQASKDAIPALVHWSNVPFYVVGEATAAAVRGVQERYQDYGFTTVRTVGESSGTGEKLGHFIVQHHSPEAGKLLYLTGDKNRDTVASILSKNGIPFQPLRVYETSQRSDFGSLLQTAVDSLSSSASHDFWWTVYFAPSTAKFAFPAVRQLLQSKNIANRIGSIGPVTSSSIEKDFGISVDVTAPRPDASALAESILAYDCYLQNNVNIPLHTSYATKEARIDTPYALDGHPISEAKTIHRSLKELLKTKEPYDKEVEFQRKNLRKRYLNLLLLHPYANETKGVEAHLWMQTSYAFVASYKHRISIIDRAIQTSARQSEQHQGKQQQNQKQNPHGPVEYRKLLQQFRQFLAEEERFWIQLVLRMYRLFNLKEADPALTSLLITEPDDAANSAEANGIHSIFPQEPSNALTPGTEAEKESRLSVMNKAIIYLGDIARYRELYNESGGRPRAGHEAGARDKIRRKGNSGIETVAMARNYDRAQQRYEQARLLLPNDGNASHQLAIVASYISDGLGSLTHYYRALCVKHPFQPAAENMVTHMTKTLQLWNRSRQQRERITASTPVSIVNQVNIFKDRVVVLHAIWRNPIDQEVKEQERRVYEEFRRLVGGRDLPTDTICNVIVLSQGALWKHRMTRDNGSANSRHEAPRALRAHLLLEWRLFGHLLDMHIALLDVGKHELKEVPSMDNVDKGPAPQITATFRRILPSLRIASKWLRGNLVYVMQDPEFKAYQQKKKAKGAKIPQKGEGKISGHSHHTVRFWNRYTQFMTALVNAFPDKSLLPLTISLEEDIDMRGFLPLKEVVGESFFLSDSRNSGRVLNEEQLMRISDLLADAYAMVGTDISPITYDAGVFKLKESVLEPRSSRHRSTGPNPPPLQGQNIMEAIRDSKSDEPPKDEDALTEGSSLTDDDVVNEAFRFFGLEPFNDDGEDEDEILWNLKATSPPVYHRSQHYNHHGSDSDENAWDPEKDYWNNNLPHTPPSIWTFDLVDSPQAETAGIGPGDSIFYHENFPWDEIPSSLQTSDLMNHESRVARVSGESDILFEREEDMERIEEKSWEGQAPPNSGEGFCPSNVAIPPLSGFKSKSDSRIDAHQTGPVIFRAAYFAAIEAQEHLKLCQVDIIRALDRKETLIVAFAGFNEGLIQEGSGLLLQEVHIAASKDLELQQQDLDAVGKACSPFPSMIFMPSGKTLRPPVFNADGKPLAFEDLVKSFAFQPRFDIAVKKGKKILVAHESTTQQNQSTGDNTEDGQGRTGSLPPGSRRASTGFMNARSNSGDGPQLGEEGDDDDEMDPTPRATTVREDQNNASTANKLESGKYIQVPQGPPTPGDDGATRRPHNIHFDISAEIHQPSLPGSGFLQKLQLTGKFNFQVTPGQTSSVDFTKMQCQAHSNPGASYRYSQSYLKILIDSHSPRWSLDDHKPESTRASDGQVKRIESEKAGWQQTVKAGLSLIPFGAPVKAEGSLSRTGERSTTNEAVCFNSRIIHRQNRGVFWWSFHVDDEHEKECGIVLAKESLPSAKMSVLPSASSNTQPLDKLTVEMTSFWSLLRKPEGGGGWFSYTPGDTLPPGFSNLCQVICIDLPPGDGNYVSELQVGAPGKPGQEPDVLCRSAITPTEAVLMFGGGVQSVDGLVDTSKRLVGS